MVGLLTPSPFILLYFFILNCHCTLSDDVLFCLLQNLQCETKLSHQVVKMILWTSLLQKKKKKLLGPSNPKKKSKESFTC